jgi:hypothetical protein
MSEDRAGPRVAAVLEGIALQNACGALEVEGRPGGVIYLDKGQITYAESDWSPDLAARLLGTLRSAAGLRELIGAGDQPAGNLGALLIEHGHVSADELAALLHSVIVDAIIALTVPLADEAEVAGMRLVSGRLHWAGAFTRLPISAVRTEAISRAEPMAAFSVSRNAPLELCDLAGESAVLTGGQWALASEMTGAFSAKDLAWAAGFSMYETVRYVGDLVEAGLCTPRLPGESTSDLRTSLASFDLDAVSELSAGPAPSQRAASRPHAAPPAVGSSPGARSMPRRKPGESGEVARAASAAAHALVSEAEARNREAAAKMVARATSGLISTSGKADPSSPVGTSAPLGGSGAVGASSPAGASGPVGASGAVGVGGPSGPGGSNGRVDSDGSGDASGQADAAALFVESEFTPVPVDSLRRVLDGLRKLS